MKQDISIFTQIRRWSAAQAKVLFCLIATLGTMSGKAADSTFLLKGYVKDDTGRGIAGVVVNNGANFTTTDKHGAWTLPTDTTVSKFISISTPKEFQLPNINGLASHFYKSVAEAVANKTDNVFVLTRREKPSDAFHYIAISDPQILNAHDMKRWRNETVDDIMRTAAALRKTGEVVA